MKQTFTIDVPAVAQMKQDDDGAYRRVITRPAGRSKVVVTIDVDKIAQRLGARAVFSKSGKATYLGGLVSVRNVGEA